MEEGVKENRRYKKKEKSQTDVILHKMTEFHLIQMFSVRNFSDPKFFQSQLSKPLLMKIKKKKIK